ncbi:MAG: hypothetical protein Q7K43_03405, partial [Candidatus Woesearchaeota archaeon]|nr:hypothetical protein [Candidatus Woesearchaeota archaeon]
MPPGGAPAAPAMPSAPGGGGIEARPAVVAASAPPQPEVSMDPARIAARQQEVARVAPLPPDAALADLDRAHEAARAAGAAVSGTAEGQAQDASIQQSSESPSATQALQDEITRRVSAVGGLTEEGVNKITAEVYDAYVVENPDLATQYADNDPKIKAALERKTAREQTGEGQQQVVGAQVDQENAVAAGVQTTAPIENQQPAQQTEEQVVLNEPSEETIQQALRAMGKDDTPANREAAKQLIAAKEQQEKTKAEAAAKELVEKVNPESKKKETLLPEEQKLMEGMSKLIAENTDQAEKWLAVLAKEDPEYFTWLQEKLDIYKKQEEAKNSKYYMAAGIMGFLMF